MARRIGGVDPRLASPAPSAGFIPVSEAAPENISEVALTHDERAFLHQMIATWEDSLPPAHLLRIQTGQTRTVRYARNAEPTRLFLIHARVSSTRRWWRALRSHMGA